VDRVLLVDDEPDVLIALSRALRREPYDVVCAGSAAEALALLGEEDIDLVVSDCEMPALSGIDFLSRVRQAWPSVIRFMLTGRPTVERAVDAINVGAVHRFFTKPCQAAELGLAIREGLRERSVAAALSDGEVPAVLTTGAGEIVAANRAFGRLTGRAPSTLAGTPLRQILAPEQDDETAAELSAGEDRSTPSEGRVRRADGSEVDVELSCRPAGPGAPLLVTVARDISHRKSLEGQLVQLQKMEVVAALTAGLAHDFRNFLGVIGGQAELMLADVSPDHTHHRRLSSIQRVVATGMALTERLLAFSRKEPVGAQMVSVGGILADMERMLLQAVRPGLTLTVHPDAARALWVRAAPGCLEQVIMNLVINARDAIPGEGRIDVWCEAVTLDAGFAARRPEVRPGRYARVSVSDTGCGMTAETRARIFDPFFTTKSPGKGTGLGLSTVHTIVRQYRGTVTVDSTPGNGTRFDVYLPIAGTAASAAKGEAAPGSLG
jgi:PAS domain S-box-containing protein